MSDQPSYDRRTEPRIPFVADIQYEVDGARFSRRAADLSMTGIYIEDSQPPETGSWVDVDLLLGDCQVTVSGRVVQSQPPFGFAVHFVVMDPSDRELLGLYVMSQAEVVAT